MRTIKTRRRPRSKRHLPLALARLDQRTDAAIRLRTSYERIVRELGGEDAISRVRLGLICEYVFLEYEVDRIAARIVKASKPSDELNARWTNRHNLLLGLRKQLDMDVEPAKEHASDDIHDLILQR